MTMSHQAGSPAARLFPSFRRRLRWRRAGSLLARWYDRYLQRAALAELDARLLADIGRTSEEASRECAKAFWRK